MKKYFAVIDTNVIVSSFLHHDSVPGKVVDCIRERTIVPLYCKEILDEYSEVLTRNRFGIQSDAIESFLRDVHETGIEVGRTPSLESFPDKDDIVFYEVALSGRSTMDAYLVTGNLKHYPVVSYVVTPREMLDIIEKNL